VHAVVRACAVVRLIGRPLEVVREGDALRACAPRPLPLATALRAAGPVIQVELPSTFKNICLLGNAEDFDFCTFDVVAETLEL